VIKGGILEEDGSRRREEEGWARPKSLSRRGTKIVEKGEQGQNSGREWGKRKKEDGWAKEESLSRMGNEE
jgi:hypothetical protein